MGKKTNIAQTTVLPNLISWSNVIPIKTGTSYFVDINSDSEVYMDRQKNPE